MFKRSLVLSLIIFQVLVLLIVVATILTPSQQCPMIVSYYDVQNQPIEVNILKSEYSYISKGDLNVICRYKKLTVDSLGIRYYND